MPEQKVQVKVAESKIKHSSKNGRLHLTFDSRYENVKKGLHEIIQKLKKQPGDVDDLKAKQSERKPGFESIEWWSVLPSVLLPNAEMPYTWFSNLKKIIIYIPTSLLSSRNGWNKVHVNAVSLAQDGGSET